MSEASSATFLWIVESGKKIQKNKETHVITHGFKKLSKHEAEEKRNNVLSFLKIETERVKTDSNGTTNEQNKQLLLVELPNPKTN